MEKMYVSVELEKLKEGIVDAVNNSPIPYCLKQVAASHTDRAAPGAGPHPAENTPP